jgi:hypothetical protein
VLPVDSSGGVARVAPCLGGKANDEDITSMDTTSPIRWGWSLTCFQTAGKHLLATIVMASYGFQFGSSTTP